MTLTIISGVSSGLTVMSGDTLSVTPSGELVDTTIESGGAEFANSRSTSNTVQHGGVLVVTYSGVVADDTVLGTENILPHGHAYRAILESGGKQLVGEYAFATRTTVESGSTLTAVKTGTLNGATVEFGGTILTMAESLVTGGLFISGLGSAVIKGAVASGAHIYLRNGFLGLGNVGAFHGEIAGMRNPAQRIDLLAYGFTSSETAAWSQSGTSGTLTITDGAKVANLELIGQYATSDFVLSAGAHHSGTVIAVAALTQAAAAMSPRSSTPGLSIHEGGRAEALAPTAYTTSGRA